MNCPVCDEKLRDVERNGVTVDICPACKGVWLDRGELEKILDLVHAGGPPTAQQAAPPPAEQRPYDTPPPGHRDHHDDRHDDRHSQGRDDDDRDYRHDDSRYRDGRRRRGGWLGQILDGLGGEGD